MIAMSLLLGGIGGSKLALCDALQSGDWAGAWEGLTGDGSMKAGSASTWVATGAPTNSVVNGWKVRTYTAAQNDQQPANGAIPASSFSILQHVNFSAFAVSQVSAFGNSGAGPATYGCLPFEINGTGTSMRFYCSDGVGSVASAPLAFAFATGTWYLLSFTYERVGGAGNNIGRLYVNGTEIGNINTLPLIAGTFKWTSNGYAGGALGSAKSIAGQALTYKLLSAADISRIYSYLPSP